MQECNGHYCQNHRRHYPCVTNTLQNQEIINLEYLAMALSIKAQYLILVDLRAYFWLA
uniref:Uncharacterized protein n=1 Tax=Arundo donax TaxID=35708 RepID=A0A0A9EXU9_ARUDO